MKNKLLIFLGIGIATFAFIQFILSPVVYHNSIFIFAILASLALGTGIFFGFKPSDDERFDPETFKAANSKMNIGIMGGIFVAVASLIFGFFNLESRKTKYLKDNAEIVRGEILNGESKTKKTGRFGTSTSTDYKIKVKFMPKNADKYFTEETEVGSDVYENAGLGQKILVAYIKDDPTYLEVLNNEKSIKEFRSKIKNNSLTYENLISFSDKKDSLNTHMKSISEFWDRETLEDSYFEKAYSNLVNNDEIAIKKDGEVTFMNQKNSITFDSIFAYAKSNLKTVYDSFPSNTVKGAKFTDDKFDIYFEKYSIKKEQNENERNNYGMPVNLLTSRIQIRCIIVTKKGNPVILPGEILQLTDKLNGVNTNNNTDKLDELIEKIQNQQNK